MSDPSTPITRIAEIVEQDIAMSAKVLHLVNSAFFGLPQKVTSLHGAVGYLGMDTIKNLVLVADTFKAFVPDRRISQSVHESLQQHAHRTANIAGKLPVHPLTKNLIILAAFLHDIGKLVLASKLPTQFCSVLALASERGCEVFEEIGAYLLGLWGLPHLAVEAIAHHHHPTRIPHSDFDGSTAILCFQPVGSRTRRYRGLDNAHPP